MHKRFTHIVTLLSLLLLPAWVVPAAARAGATTTVPLVTAGGTNIYSWCGRYPLMDSLLPDATSPLTPGQGCGVYSGQYAVSDLTAGFVPQAAGGMVVSLYSSNGTRPVTLSLYVNGTQSGSTLYFPHNTSGSWFSFPAVTVQPGDEVEMRLHADWYGTGTVRITGVHASLTPSPSTLWSQIGSPGNWATTPIPASTAMASGVSPQNGKPLAAEVPRELAGQAAADAYVNMTAYTPRTNYLPLATPLQPVRLCRSTGACVPDWGAQVDDLWRAAMGLGNNAVPNRITGQCAAGCTYLGGGVPMAAGVQGAPGTDKEAVLCLGGGDSGQPPWTLNNPDGWPFVRPDGQQIEGNCWEVWGLQPDPTYDPAKIVSPTNTRWMIAWGAHRTGFITQPTSTPNTTYGYALDTLSGQYCPRSGAGEWKCGGVTDAIAQRWFGPDVLTPGAPDSTTYDVGWGVTASELPLLTDVVQQQDCDQVLDGAPDFGHAVGIQLQYTRYAGRGLHVAWWPAGASDGNDQQMASVEGMRLYFPPSVTMPTDLTRSGQALFRTLQEYGLVIDDTTGGGPAVTYNSDGSYAGGGALDLRVALPDGATGPCNTLGMPSALVNIPWSQLRLIKEGSDGDADPAQ